MVQAKDIPDIRLLTLIQEHDEHGGLPAYRVLYDEGFPPKVVEAKYERFFKRGWIEYGVSLRTAWLTSQGRRALAEVLDAPLAPEKEDDP